MKGWVELESDEAAVPDLSTQPYESGSAHMAGSNSGQVQQLNSEPQAMFGMHWLKKALTNICGEHS